MSTLMETPLGESTRARNGADSTAASASDAFWRAAADLYSKWKLIATITAFAAVGAIGVALLLPREYAAEARVLQPEGGGIGGLMGMMDRATGGLGRLLTQRGGEFTRYMALLDSRSLLENVVDEFDLVEVYGLQDDAHPQLAAVETLRKNVSHGISLEYNYLSVVAFDRDPERAAAMANYMVAELNRMNARLSSENARDTRIFVESRLREAEMALDSVRLAMQDFQEQHGVVQLESQAEAFMAAIAGASSRLAELEVRYQTLLTQYGPDNPQVSAARDGLAAARRQQAGVLRGGDVLLPVELRRLPTVSREYAEIVQAQMIQAQIIETIYPLYEQARFQERSETRAVQILDGARAPTRPARPSRRLIVLVVTLTGFFLACLFVLGQRWLNMNHASISDRLRITGSQSAGQRRN